MPVPTELVQEAQERARIATAKAFKNTLRYELPGLVALVAHTLTADELNALLNSLFASAIEGVVDTFIHHPQQDTQL